MAQKEDTSASRLEFFVFSQIFQVRLKRIAGISFAESLSGQLTKEEPAAMRLFFLFPLSP